jgi:hypothetical protein
VSSSIVLGETFVVLDDQSFIRWQKLFLSGTLDLFLDLIRKVTPRLENEVHVRAVVPSFESAEVPTPGPGLSGDDRLVPGASPGSRPA